MIHLTASDIATDPCHSLTNLSDIQLTPGQMQLTTMAGYISLSCTQLAHSCTHGF